MEFFLAFFVSSYPHFLFCGFYGVLVAFASFDKVSTKVEESENFQRKMAMAGRDQVVLLFC